MYVRPMNVPRRIWTKYLHERWTTLLMNDILYVKVTLVTYPGFVWHFLNSIQMIFRCLGIVM